MRRYANSCVLIALIFAGGASSMLHALNKQKQAQALALLKKFHDTTDIRGEGSTPFRMDGDFKFYRMENGVVTGKYVIVWGSANRWHEEVGFPGFHQTQVGGKSRVWIARNISYGPLRLTQLKGAIDIARRGILAPDDKITAVHHNKVDGQPAVCVMTRRKKWEKELCFGAADGLLVRETTSREITKFDDYEAFGSKLFPRTIRVFESNDLVLEFHVTAVQAEPNPDPGLFVPPEDAVEWKTCADQKPPLSIAHPMPQFLESMHRNLKRGVQVIYLLIDVDGSVRNATILQSINPEMDELTLNTIHQQWKFTPSMCGDVPVRSEITIDLAFGLD